MAILFVGIDLAKNVFAIHGVDEPGKTVLVRPSVQRVRLQQLVAPLSPCTICMEACSAVHPLGEAVRATRANPKPDGGQVRRAPSHERQARRERRRRGPCDLRGAAALPRQGAPRALFPSTLKALVADRSGCIASVLRRPAVEDQPYARSSQREARQAVVRDRPFPAGRKTSGRLARSSAAHLAKSLIAMRGSSSGARRGNRFARPLETLTVAAASVPSYARSDLRKVAENVSLAEVPSRPFPPRRRARSCARS